MSWFHDSKKRKSAINWICINLNGLSFKSLEFQFIRFIDRCFICFIHVFLSIELPVWYFGRSFWVWHRIRQGAFALWIKSELTTFCGKEFDSFKQRLDVASGKSLEPLQMKKSRKWRNNFCSSLGCLFFCCGCFCEKHC